MKIRIVATVCDKCGNRVPEDREDNVTMIGVAGNDKDINGSYDICEDCIDGVRDALGIGHHPARPKAKRAAVGKPKVKRTAKGGGSAGSMWSADELETLRRMRYTGASYEQIAEALPGRTAKAVQIKSDNLRRKMAQSSDDLTNSSNYDTME